MCSILGAFLAALILSTTRCRADQCQLADNSAYSLQLKVFLQIYKNKKEKITVKGTVA
jgi:hypothetical protein